jgi:hypothetical protein
MALKRALLQTGQRLTRPFRRNSEPKVRPIDEQRCCLSVMKQQIHARPRAIAMLMAAVALPLTPVLAQDATTAPPPVAATVPQPAAPAPAAEPAPSATPSAPVFAPQSPVVQAVPVRPAPVAEPAAEAAPSETTAAARPAPRRATSAPRVARGSEPQRPATSSNPAPAPVTNSAIEPAPVPPVAEAPAPVTSVPSTLPEPAATPLDTTAASSGTSAPWLLIGAGIAALALILIGLATSRRRSRRAETVDHVAPTIVREPPMPRTVTDRVVEPDPVPTPVVPAAAMRAPEPALERKVEPVIAQGAQGERPWIGLSLAPICAGTSEGGPMVQYELIVDNASDVAANDVRVSSFMIDGARSSPAELAMIEPMGETQEQTIDVMANGSVPITTTIHVDRGAIAADSFVPTIVAEARYPLPGGGEGHFAARFAIGIADGDAIKAVGIRDGDGMHDDVGAKLDDVLERV